MLLSKEKTFCRNHQGDQQNTYTYLYVLLLLLSVSHASSGSAIHGGWSSWSHGVCPVSCIKYPKNGDTRYKTGSGLRPDTRTCTNPRPKYGGKSCRGVAKRKKGCAGPVPGVFLYCPIDGAWGDWMPWGNCSARCGETGVRRRTRDCNNPHPQLKGKTCVGALTETKSCTGGGKCPFEYEKEWTEETPCSFTCGGGRKTLEKRCKPKQVGCTPLRKAVICSDFACPVDGGYTEWSDWGPCSSTCGPGLSERTRNCTAPSPKADGKECEEMPFEEKR